jgi:hypothetical protein
MTARELIKKLKNLPPDLEVITSQHDNAPLEYQNSVNSVCVVDYDEIRKNVIVQIGDDMGLIGEYIVLS